MSTPSRGGVAGSYVTNLTVTYGATLATNGQGANWFGPLVPLRPTAPPEVASRQWDYPSGYNLATQPRQYEAVTFGTLRALADGYDILRLVIETRKDQISRMPWSIRLRDDKAKDKKNARVEAATTFFQRPDMVHGWPDWLRMVLEDLFVIDAPALYMQRNRGGQLIALMPLDGATIKPVIDDWGRTPQPYSEGGTAIYPVAYQQSLKGFPAVDYSVRDLLYRPRNVRAHKAYGYSPVEQVMTTVNIALRRQLFTLSYFTEGSVPDAIMSVPETWTPDQIKAYQIHFDAYYGGNDASRRKIKMAPGGAGFKVHETKQPELSGEFDSWLARVICFAFSVSPQALQKMMNRASADTQKESSEEEGLQPVLFWVKQVLDDVLSTQMGAPDLEFVWVNEDEVDEAQQQITLTGYSGKGVLTINEVRHKLGFDPLPDPEADQGMIVTSTGIVPLSSYVQGQQAAKENAALAAQQLDAQTDDTSEEDNPEDDDTNNTKPKAKRN